MRLRLSMRMRLRNASAPIKPFFDECEVFAMRMRLQVVCHTPPGRRNMYIYIYECVYTYLHIYIKAYMQICSYTYIHIYI